MNANDLIKLVVGVVVGALMLSAILIPTINSATTTERTFTNDGYYTMNQLDTATEATITWEKSNIDIVNVNGIDVDMSDFVGTNHTSFTLIGGESIVVRYEKTSTTFAGIQAYGSNGVYASFHSNTATETGNKITITVSEGTVNVLTDGSTPLTRTFTNVSGYIINPDGTGDYAIMKRADIPAYVHGDSEIRLIGVSVSAGPNAIALYGAGTLNDGITLTTIYQPSNVTTVTYSEAVATDSTVSGYEDLYKLEKYEFTINYDENSYNATYSYFIVPVSITAELTGHASEDEIKILEVIPMLVTVGLILGVVGVAFSRRE